MLRVRVEIVPWGEHDLTETMFEAYIANDGTGHSNGANGGGVGNYYLSLSDMAHRSMPSALPGYLGRLEGLERTPWHRLVMAKTALERVQEQMEAAHAAGIEDVGWRNFGDAPNKGLVEAIDRALEKDRKGD